MAPNIIPDENDSVKISEQSKTRETQPKELYYNGYFYDVTDFIPRHPGGSLIKFYTEPGEDATQAISQFHFRSMKKVELIMRSLPRRLAQPHERELSSEVFTRHEALTADFNLLFNELKAEGYFEPSIRHVIIRIIEPIAITLISLGIFFQSNTMITKFFSTIFVGFALSRFGWLMHEGGHASLTGKPNLDKFLQLMGMTFTIGASSVWWNSQHNRHHAMPQRLAHDVDLATLPYVAFHKKTVTKPNHINSFFVRYQAILYWTLDLLVLHIAWRFYLHPRYQIRRKAYHELFLELPGLIFVILEVGIGWHVLNLYWTSFFLGINFALSHSHLDVADKPTHWIEYSLTHTANIRSSLFVDYFMGYLNYQIEHHLFPTMPQFKQKQIGYRVRALAKKHGLPYQVYSYIEACTLAVKNLNDVGKQLTDEKYFSNNSIVNKLNTN